MANITTEYMGLKLKNPIIAGSSGWTDNVESILNLEKAGCSAVVLKSLFEEEIVREMNINMSKMTSDSFLYPETIDFYEQNNFPKQSTDQYLELITEAKSKLSIPIIASVNCVTPDQWTYFPKRIEEAGADAIELNLFILPTDFSKTAAQNEEVYFKIIESVKKTVKIPVSVKLSTYFSSLSHTLFDISQKVDGIVLFNRFHSPDINIDTLEINPITMLSTSGDMKMALRWTAILANRIKCDLCASTGVHDAEAMIKMLLAGSSAVQIVSTLYKNGSETVGQMINGLDEWMTKKSFSDISQFKGLLSQSKHDNAAVYDRVQFMKYFRGY